MGNGNIETVLASSSVMGSWCYRGDVATLGVPTSWVASTGAAYGRQSPFSVHNSWVRYLWHTILLLACLVDIGRVLGFRRSTLGAPYLHTVVGPSSGLPLPEAGCLGGGNVLNGGLSINYLRLWSP